MAYVDPDDFDSPEDYEAFKKSLCETCGGHGQVYEDEDDEEGRPCPDCDGTGTKPEKQEIRETRP
jgi:DnaJ-class molecular chaperone